MPDIVELQTKAMAGDALAKAKFTAHKWNAYQPVGTRVTYEKSPQEGRIILKTAGKAYVLGKEAVIELEHIGTAMLNKIEVLPEQRNEMSAKHTITGILAATALCLSAPVSGYLTVLLGRYFGVALLRADNFEPFGSVSQFVLLAILGATSIGLISAVLLNIPRTAFYCNQFGKAILATRHLPCTSGIHKKS